MVHFPVSFPDDFPSFYPENPVRTASDATGATWTSNEDNADGSSGGFEVSAEFDVFEDNAIVPSDRYAIAAPPTATAAAMEEGTTNTTSAAAVQRAAGAKNRALTSTAAPLTASTLAACTKRPRWKLILFLIFMIVAIAIAAILGGSISSANKSNSEAAPTSNVGGGATNHNETQTNSTNGNSTGTPPNSTDGLPWNNLFTDPPTVAPSILNDANDPTAATFPPTAEPTTTVVPETGTPTQGQETAPPTTTQETSEPTTTQETPEPTDEPPTQSPTFKPTQEPVQENSGNTTPPPSVLITLTKTPTKQPTRQPTVPPTKAPTSPPPTRTPTRAPVPSPTPPPTSKSTEEQPQPRDSFMTEENWLVAHNVRRQALFSQNGISSETTTSDLLLWSKGLQQSAQTYANKLVALPECQIKHGHDGDRYGGENLAMQWTKSNQGGWTPDKVLVAWYDKEADLPLGENGHYTQVAWRATHYVGCAEATKELWGGTCFIQVCRYVKPGNCNMPTNMKGVKEAMLASDSPCGPECPPEGCHS